MNIFTLLQTIRNQVAEDANIKAWCNLYYSQVHTVYIGMDLNNLPGEGDTPLVYLFPSGKQSGYALEAQPHQIIATCELFNKNYEQVYGFDNCYEYTGVEHIVGFRKLVENSILAAISTLPAMEASDMETLYSPVEEFPFFQAVDVYTINQRLYQGDDPFS